MKKLISSITVIAALCVAVAQASESFGGFGISVYPGKNGASVASVLPNSPAAQAGLQAGDVIISVNGTLLSSVAPEKQISLLRGNSGSSADLKVSRGGESISIFAKRALISVKDIENQDISAWLGKSKNLNVEDLNYLASQKIGDGYEFLGLMQKGLLISSNMENLNPKQIHQISLKKESSAKDNLVSPANVPATPTANALNFANRSTISFSLANEANFSKIAVLNAKGATVWQKNLGKLPPGANNIDWNGASLPAGSYHIMLEADGKALVYKFELR